VVEVAEGLMVRQATPAREHHLNNTASIVLQLCDGERSVAEIARLVAEAFGLASAPVAEVSACVEELRRAGVLVEPAGSREESDGLACGGIEAKSPAADRATLDAAPERRPPGTSGGYPGVSCICSTYGRPAEVVEEAIQSFLLQDYPGPKELVVLNDFEQRVLTFGHPEVSVINVPRRFRTLGEKYNAAVALTSHDLIFVWDDDDIYLPHRLSFSVERFDVRKAHFKPSRAWFWNDGRLSGPEANRFASGACWSRDLFERARSYAPMGFGHDADMEARFEEIAPGSTSSYDIAPEEIFYIYRWDTGTYHGSELGRDQHRAVGEFVHEQTRSGMLATGPIALTPRWKADYVELVRQRLASSAERLPGR
jgi:hypothetical protein